MKKSLVLGIVSLAAAAITSYGQGYITLDNYSSGSNPMITYGAGVPVDGVLGNPTLGSGGLNSTWTAGLYWAAGNIGLVEAAGTGMPSGLLALGTTPGSTIAFDTQNAVGNPGYFGSISAWNSGSTLNTTLTLEIVIYPTAAGSYALANYRIHSAAFTMATVSASNPTPIYAGDFMGGPLQALPIPEPTTLALAGLGGLSLLLMRRKQS